MRFLLALMTATVVLALFACRNRPFAGGPCRVADQIACEATDRALLCDSHSWVQVLCRGQQGCARREDDECDDTLASEGDRCAHNPPLDYACTSDRSKALVCKEGRFAVWRHCRGPNGCMVIDGRNIHCDTTLGEPGDGCGEPGTYACTADRQTMLICDGSRLSTASSCRGPGGCHIDRESQKVDCDDAVAIEGDPCDRPKRIACSVDGKAELVCLTKKYVKKRDCIRGDCRLEGSELFCD